MEVGIIGGAFDPATGGHVEVAKTTKRLAKLDQVWLMPCYKHLYDKHMADASHRYNICQIITKKYPEIIASMFEIENKFSGSTYEMLVALIKEFPNKYSLVIGMDNANTIDQWKSYEKLLKLVRFIIVPRKGITKAPIVDELFVGDHIILDCEIPFTRSTDVREYIKCGEYDKAKELLCPQDEIWEYIVSNKLYGVKNV